MENKEVVERGQRAQEILDGFLNFRDTDARSGDDWDAVVAEFHDVFEDAASLTDIPILPQRHIAVIRVGGKLFVTGTTNTAYQEPLTDERITHLLSVYYWQVCEGIIRAMKGLIYSGECAQIALDHEAKEAAQ